MKKIYLIIALILSLNLSAKTYENNQAVNEYFELLSHDSTYFEPDGAVCERVALHEVDVLYPNDKFEIINGLQYDDKKSTIGELDLVIFDRSTGMVEAIAEVKCWKSYEGALKKVKDQRNRFKLYLNRNIIISDENGKKFPKELFNNVKRYFSISQKGGMDHGFDFELSLNSKESSKLQHTFQDLLQHEKYVGTNSKNSSETNHECRLEPGHRREWSHPITKQKQ